MTRPRKKYKKKYSADRMYRAHTERLFAECKRELNASNLTGFFAELWEALDAMKKGEATIAQYNLLSGSANMASILSEKGLGSWHRDNIRACVKHLVKARSHHETTGRFILSGEGAKSVAQMIEYREEVLTLDGYTEGDEYKAAQLVSARIHEGHVIRPENLIC